MAEHQGNSPNGPHWAAERSASGSKENFEHRDGAGKHPQPQDPALRQGATVSQVLAPTSKPGNPGPLGLISFALTTFVLGLYECGAGYF